MTAARRFRAVVLDATTRTYADVKERAARGVRACQHLHIMPPDRFAAGGKRSGPVRRPREATHRRRGKPQEKASGKR